MEREIINNTIKYLSEILEKPSSDFGGFAPCPFARSERLSKKLFIGMYDYCADEFIEHFDSTMIQGGYSSALYALFSGDRPEVVDAKDTKKFQHFLNKLLIKSGFDRYKVVCFNPLQEYYAGNSNVRAKAPYFLINVADRDVLLKAHNSLKKTKYYDNYSSDYLKYIDMI